MSGPVYLDYATTSRWKSREALHAVERFTESVGVGPGRGSHRLARDADDMVRAARSAVGRLVGARHARSIVFTANATQSLNTAIHGVVEPGCHVVTTSYEHNSVLRPLEALARAGTLSYTVVPCDGTGRIRSADLAAAFTPSTRLVVVNHASNVTGAVAPVAEIVSISHDMGALVLLDAAQTAGFLPLEDDAIGCDLVAITGHKSLRAPSGIGALYVREGVAVEPLLQGGSGTNSASPVHPRGMPERLEAGTPNYMGIAGLGAAALAYLGMDAAKHRATVRALVNRLEELVTSLPGVTAAPVPDCWERVGILSIISDRLSTGELGAHLDAASVCVRVGLQCAPEMHRAIGTAPDGTVRFSLGHETSIEDVERAAEAVASAVRSQQVRA
jgi:cysteine desulfurase / selenocysteine lyase